jgi:hypothetical protein
MGQLVPAGQAGGVAVGGELLGAGGRPGGAQEEPAVPGVDAGHGPVGDPDAGGVDLLGLLALGDPAGGLLLLRGALLGDLLVGLLPEVGDGALDLQAAADHDGPQAGVAAGVVAVLVGEDRAELGLAQAREQRQADVQAAAAGKQTAEAGALHHGGVDVGGQDDGVRGTGAGGLGQVTDHGPQARLGLLGEGHARRLLDLRQAEHEHAADHRDGEHHRHQPDLAGDAARGMDGGPVDGQQQREQHQTEQLESREQDQGPDGPQRGTHGASLHITEKGMTRHGRGRVGGSGL